MKYFDLFPLKTRCSMFSMRSLKTFLTSTAAIALVSIAALVSPAHAAKKTVHFYNDIAGSPQLAVDADTGQVLWKENYRPYGERINNSPASATGKGKNELYFHGKQAETLNNGVTIQYFGARYYMPGLTDRFTSVDPIHFTESSIHSFNRFAYGNNNPYRYRDPDGNIPLDTILDVGSIIWDAGRGLGAAAAYVHGAFTGNASLKAVASEGLRETGVDLGISVGAAFTPYISAGMVKGGIKIVDDAPTTIYKRPSGATTAEQRASVQGKPCVDCGATTAKQYADHKTPLVVEHYTTGGIDKQRMRSIEAVQPQCPTCSSRQGGILSQYSKEMKDSIGK
jgi:RHS repeat-associated protein